MMHCEELPTYEYILISSSKDYMPGALGQFFEIAYIEYRQNIYGIAWEYNGDRVLVSDEGYWNPIAPVGDELSKLINLAHFHNYSPGINLTPYALESFGGNATPDQLIDSALRADWVSINPYNYGGRSEELLAFSAAAIDIVHSMGKKIILILQGFAVPGTTEIVQEYNKNLVGLNFDEIFVGDAYDWLDIPDEWQIQPLPAELIGIGTYHTEIV